jgi:hypothetical protein
MTNDPTPERLLVICRLTVTSDLPQLRTCRRAAITDARRQQQTHAAQHINFIIRSPRQREPRKSAGSLIRAPWRSSD